MSFHKKRSYTEVRSQTIGSGPYMARVVGHSDPEFMGTLEVQLIRRSNNTPGADTQTYLVRYASPFFGYTAFEYMGHVDGNTSTVDGYNDTQKSYGMWMIPPDVGVTVMVMFVDGDPGQGYWFACIPDIATNHMVPGIAASAPSKWEMSGSQKAKYDPTSKIPVAEINRRINKEKQQPDPKNITKPAHPITRWFFEEGLLEDEERGITSSSARRNLPSMTFGISTPGPLHRTAGDLDWGNGKKGKIGTEQHNVNYWISRLGGSQFVMDDGDDRYNRVDIPSKAPMKYVDDPDGKRFIPKDELVRLRTRTGHQLLFHNSEDLIYLSNSRGTAWLEFTSDGKIDIYARDAINVHTQSDFNFRADRDINLEAGRNINMKATAEYFDDVHEAQYDGTTKNINVKLFEKPSYKDGYGQECGRIQLESAYNFNMLCGRNMKIQLREEVDTDYNPNPEDPHNLWIKVQGDMKLSVRDEDDEMVDGPHDHEDENDAKVKGLHIVSHENTRIETGQDDTHVDKFANPGPYHLYVLTHGETRIKTEKAKTGTGDMHIWTENNHTQWQGVNYDIKSGGHHWETSGATNETNAGGNIIETAPQIHMNGPQAATAAKAKEAQPAENAEGIAGSIKKFVLYECDIMDETLEWKATRYLEPGKKLKSINRRVPMHEPWAPKENLDPLNLKPDKIDREENHK